VNLHWVGTVELACEHGMSWVDADRIICEKTHRVRRRGRAAVMFGLLHLGCLFWIFSGARWLFPNQQGMARLGLDLLALLGMTPILFLPRLLAHAAILPRARDHATGRAIQNS
jgi:hypothetical protein